MFTPNPSKNVFTINDALKWRSELRNSGKKLVLTNGCFDVIHRGHVEYLNTARALGDALVIAMNSDSSVKALKGPERPINNEKDRAYLLASLRAVDAVVVFDTPRCTELLQAISPDIYVKGGDYNIDNIDREEKEALMQISAEIKFVPFISGFSTTELLAKLAK